MIHIYSSTIQHLKDSTLHKSKKMRSKKNWLVALLCVLTIGLQSQTMADIRQAVKDTSRIERNSIGGNGLSSKNRKKADEKYEDLGYKTSVDLYQNLSRKEKKDMTVLRRMANSYRLNDEPENAAYWYSKFISETKEAEDLLNYAKVLQATGACEDAVRWYKRYTDRGNKRQKENRDFINSCAEEKVFNENSHVEITNVKVLNTSHLDFSPIPYKDGLVFTSTRGISRMNNRKDVWTKDNFSDLFYSKRKEDGTLEDPIPLFGAINGNYHDGTATFNRPGNMMFFTRNNNDGKSKKGLIDLKIYSASKDADGYWANMEELEFNSDEFTTCHPTLSPDGRRLYFASNRPGGYGGLDIYVVESTLGGWSTPQNLGPTVNSSDNEIFPFMAEDETLYYSSKGHKGLGGLDIFMAQKVDKEDEGSWSVRENMGEKFNTKKDDFGFWTNEDKTGGYLSSSRHDGYGKDDIYEWTADNNLLAMGGMPYEMCVFEAGSDRRIERAKVTITEVSENKNSNNLSDGNLMLALKPIEENSQEYVLSVIGNQTNEKDVITDFYTDTEGELTSRIKPGKQYRIKSVKKGYEDAEAIVSYEDLKSESSYCVPMKRKSCMVLNGVVINKEYLNAMPGAEVRVENKCTGETQKYTVGVDGKFDLCIECGCEYRFLGMKSGFDSDTEFLYPKSEDCDPEKELEVRLELGVRKIIKTEVVSAPPVATAPVAPPTIQYVPKVTYVPRTIYEPVTTYVPAHEMTPGMLNNHFLGDANGTYTEGMVINLKDIYYNFDKFDIRLDASKDLDRLLQLLRTYPSMHISLESHTDSRGSNAYNKNLSENRAKSARSYLISQGIAAARVTSQGFGENRLKNRCADGVVCSEAEHQQNRRTEVRVTKFDRQDVRVEYGK